MRPRIPVGSEEEHQLSRPELILGQQSKFSSRNCQKFPAVSVQLYVGSRLRRFHQPTVKQNKPFLHYASRYWMEHTKNTPENGAELLETDIDFLNSESGARMHTRWFLSYLLEVSRLRFSIKLGKKIKDFPTFSITCFCGIDSWLQILCDREVDDASRIALLNNANQSKWTPLMYAANYNKQGTLYRLLKLGAVPTHEAFKLALPYGDEALFSALIKHGDMITPNLGGTTVLLDAVARQIALASRMLLEHGAKVDQHATMMGQEISPLEIAAKVGSIPLLDMLMELNPVPSSFAEVAVQAAEIPLFQQDDIILYLLKTLPATVLPGFSISILQRCAGSGHTESIKYLLRQGTEVNQAMPLPHPLLSAIAAGPMDVVRVLLEAGAQLRCTDMDGYEALCGAAGVGNIEGAKMLIKAGFHSTYRAECDIVPLVAAAQAGHLDIVTLFLALSAYLDSKDKKG